MALLKTRIVSLHLAALPGLQECKLRVRFHALGNDRLLEVFPHADHCGILILIGAIPAWPHSKN